jgi:hypothetical protein
MRPESEVAMLHTSENFAVWTMLAGCFASIAFLLWVLVMLVIERNKPTMQRAAAPGRPKLISDRPPQQTFIPLLVPAIRYPVRVELNRIISHQRLGRS